MFNEFCWLTEAGGSQVNEKWVGYFSFYLEHDQKDFTATADGKKICFQHPSTQVFSLLINKWYTKNFEDKVALEGYLLCTPSFASTSICPISLFSQNIVSFKIMCHLPILTVLIQKLTDNYSLTNWRRVEKLRMFVQQKSLPWKLIQARSNKYTVTLLLLLFY